MKKSMAVLISGGVTAAVLALATSLAVQAGIIETPMASASASSDALAAPAPTATAGADFSQREAQYRALIEEANRRLLTADQRIAEANQRIEQANQRIRDLEQQLQQTPSSGSAAMISPDDAAAISLQAVRGAVLLETPSLVDMRGQTLYKVALDAGTLYLDPHTGDILYAVRAHQ